MQHMLENIVNTETIEENRERSGIVKIKDTMVQTMAEAMIITTGLTETTDLTIITTITTADPTMAEMTILTEEATKITNNTHR